MRVEVADVVVNEDHHHELYEAAANVVAFLSEYFEET